MKSKSIHDVIAAIESASARDDVKAAQRLYIENRISKATFDKAWASGQKLKQIIEQRKNEKNT